MSWKDNAVRIRQRLVRRDRWKAQLGIAAGSVLAMGLLLAPRAPAPVVPPPAENSAPLIREELQRRDAAQRFPPVAQLAGQTAASVVTFPREVETMTPVQTHADTGVAALESSGRDGHGLGVSADGDVLTHLDAIGNQLEPDVQLAGGPLRKGRTLAFEPETGLVLVRLVDPRALAVPRLATGGVVAGETVVAVTWAGGDPVSLPVYVATSSPSALIVAATGGPLQPGTPLFTLAGDALAVVGGPDQRATLVAGALDRLRRLADEGRGLPRTLGLVLQEVTAPLSRFFGDGAVVVARVRPGGPAARAGVRVGDAILRLAGEPMADVAATMRAIASLPLDGPAELVVRRGGKDARLEVQAVATLDPETSARAGAPATGPPAGAVFSPATLEASAIPAAAVILQVDGREATERTVLAAVRRARGPLLLYLDHRGRRFFAVAEVRP